MASSAPAAALTEAESVSMQMRPALVRYFKRKCNDVTEAEDLAQDVLVRTLAQTAGKSLEQAKGYVFRAAVNRWNDRYRRTQVRGVTLEWNDAVVAAVPEARTPEREVLGRQELHQVCSALMELSERTRDVFVLVRVEQVSNSAVAEMFGISLSAVNKHLAKALAHLDRRIGRSREAT
jgi:RNA polymerase sigma factor (sigma-70 family)